MTKKIIGSALLSGLFLLLSTPSVFAQSGQFSESLYRTLKWRQIGPANIGGRIDDIAVVEGNTNIIYIGAASGGASSGRPHTVGNGKPQGAIHGPVQERVGNIAYAGGYEYRAMAPMLRRGYATASTDAGHKGTTLNASLKLYPAKASSTVNAPVDAP